ncbi:DUF2959 family protein [Algimonas porphyrae]|nr:DUF2959 family protein [Algimonas porphyrae]
MSRSRHTSHRLALIMCAAMLVPATVTGCATAAYTIQEQFGIEKRDILVDRVGDVAKSQDEAKEEFEDALSAFRAVVAVDGGELEDRYDDLSRAYDRADAQASEVRNRVESVKRVSRDLFREWEAELDDYSDAGLRRSSERQLRQTRQTYDVLADKMDRATESMNPVLSVFRDRVLFLKHNLNARSIASLEGEQADLEDDVARLIAEMEQSISAADDFIQSMRGS